MQPIELKDILTYKYLSDPRYNPSRTRAAFVVSTANEAENSYESRLWLYEDGAVKQLTDLGKERGYHWLDDDRLIFPAVRSAAARSRKRKRFRAHACGVFHAAFRRGKRRRGVRRT